jgi:hypothetical protein
MAKECYPVAEEALVAQREYDLCVRYIPDLDARLDSMRQRRERLLRFQQDNARTRDEQEMRVLETLFAEDVGRVVEILEGAGRAADAARVRQWALAISDSPELREALGCPQAPA